MESTCTWICVLSHYIQEPLCPRRFYLLTVGICHTYTVICTPCKSHICHVCVFAAMSWAYMLLCGTISHMCKRWYCKTTANASLKYGTLFRAYGPLGRFRAHLYEYMAKFVVMDFVSSADICVATWSITDICGCTYLRICDGRVNCLWVKDTYVPRCSRCVQDDTNIWQSHTQGMNHAKAALQSSKPWST